MANHTYQTVIDAVNLILNDNKLSTYTISVVDRLITFGCVPTDSDAMLIAFSIQKGYNHVINQTNQTAVPNELNQILIDMICGEFLNVKYQTGQLTLSGLDFSGIIQSVTEGDTTVSFGSAGSDEAKFTTLVDLLINGRNGDLLCYRRIKW